MSPCRRAAAVAGAPASSSTYASWWLTEECRRPSSPRIAFASAIRRRASSTSPASARSSASGRSTTALATGLSRTAPWSSVHSAIPSSTGIGPNDAAEASQPQDLKPLALVAGAPRVDLRLPPRRLGAGALALDPRDERAHAPGPAAAEVVREQLQRGVRGGARARSAPPPGRRGGGRARARAGRALGGGVGGLLDRLVEHALRVVEPARVEQRDAERRRGPRRGRRRPPRSARPRARAGPRRPPGRRAAARPGRRSRAAAAASATSASSRGSAELGAVGAGALEVVADDLVLRSACVCSASRPAARGGPRGGAWAGRGRRPRGSARGRSGSRRRPASARGGSAGAATSAVSGAVEASSPQRRERAAAEAPALDGGVLEQRALVRAELVEPRREHGLDGRRQLALRADRHQLLEEQRVAVRRARPSARAASPGRRAAPTSASASISSSASRPSTAALRCGAAHAGRRSSSSGRPRQTSRIARAAGEGDEVVDAGRAAPARPSGRRR